jgi:SAM-dependent methyltransferase
MSTYEQLVKKLEDNSGPGAGYCVNYQDTIYGSFDLPNFQVDARRNSKMRVDFFEEGMSPVTFQNKSVLDLGSTCGHISLEIASREPSKVTGIELINERVFLANEISEYVGYSSFVKFENLDFDGLDEDLYRSDIVCAFAIFHQSTNQENFYNKLYNLTNEVLLFEQSGCDGAEDTEEMLSKAGFTSLTHIGHSAHSDRHNHARECYVVTK